MSFVNPLLNHLWSDADIADRVQSIIRSTVSAEDEFKAARLARQPVRTDAEQGFVDWVDTAVANALGKGVAARAEMALLASALKVEEAVSRLARDATGDDADTAEREAAHAVIAAATPETKALLEMRNGG